MVRYIAGNGDDSSTLHEPAPKAYLVLLVNGRVSHSFPLRGETHLGRDRSNNLVVSDQKVSRHHASLTLVDDIYIINDRGSANGTYLNGVLITQPIRLKDKDHIKMGDTHFFFTVNPPDTEAINQIVLSAPSFTPQSPPQSLSFTTFALNNRSTWLLVGCLALVIVGLLLVLAIIAGLLLGRGQMAGVPELLWLGELISLR